MRVAIIGANWGRTHVGTFRAAGCDIIAIMTLDRARARDVAAAENIPLGTDDPADLEPADIIVIASPVATHAGYLKRFASHWVWCEKPLGTTAPPAHDRAFVNYAFPFLGPARTLASTNLGTIHRALVQVGVNLDAPLSGTEWLRELACHPLAWIQRVVGPLTLRARLVRADQLGALYQAGDALVDVAVHRLPTVGIRYVIDLFGDTGLGRLQGGYAPGQGWRFAPVTVNGTAVAQAGDSASGESPDEDPWYGANRRAVAAFCQLVKGRTKSRTDRAATRAAGLFTLEDAAVLERALTLPTTAG